MKKILSLVLSVILVLSLSTIALAAPVAGIISPRWSNTLLVSPVISSADSLYSSDVIGFTGTNKISCTMVLYEKGWFNSYKEVSRDSQTVYQSGNTFVASYTYTSGKTYKLEVTAVVTLNGTNETVSVSTEKKV